MDDFCMTLSVLQFLLCVVAIFTRASGPTVCSGGSIQDVSSVNRNAMLFAEPPAFPLERACRVMLFLAPNVLVPFVTYTSFFRLQDAVQPNLIV